MQGGENGVEDASRIGEDLIVPEAQDDKSVLLQKLVAFEVQPAVGMLAAIRLDNLPTLEAGEVDNIGSNDMLPSEFARWQTTIAEHGPQAMLCFGRIGAHRARAVPQQSGALTLVI